MSERRCERLEAAIDDVGRQQVFALMRAGGWKSAEAAPLWVWEEAVRILQQSKYGEHQPVEPVYGSEKGEG